MENYKTSLRHYDSSTVLTLAALPQGPPIEVTQMPAQNTAFDWSQRSPYFEFSHVLHVEELEHYIHDFVGEKAVIHNSPHGRAALRARSQHDFDVGLVRVQVSDRSGHA
jgi:hypothetical protein